MLGLPAADELRRLAGDLVSRLEWLEFAISLGHYKPLWKGNEFRADRFGAMAARAPYVTTEQLVAWSSALAPATDGQIPLATVFLHVLDTDALFSSAGYQEVVGAQLIARLKNVPSNSIKTLAETVGLARGQAAMLIVSAEWAFSGTEFRGDAFRRAHTALRKALGTTK